MSIKTFREPEHTLLIFLTLSVLLHLAAIGVVELLPKDLIQRQRIAIAPIPVELEAPPPAPEVKRALPKEEALAKKPAEVKPPPARKEYTKPKEYVREVPRPDESNRSTEKKESAVLSSKEQRVVRETIPAPGQPAKPAVEPQAMPDGRSPKAGVPAIGSTGPEGGGMEAKPLEGEGVVKGDAGTKTGKKRPSLFPSDEQLTNIAKRDLSDKAPTKSIKRKSDASQGNAGEAPASSPTYELGHSLQINTEELDLGNYTSSIAHKLNLYWEYPLAAARNGWQGTLRMLFRINKDGSVSDFKIVRSTGYPALDENVITALKLGALYPPLPAKWEREYIEVMGEFNYVIVSAR